VSPLRVRVATDDEVTAAELFDICAHPSAEVGRVRDAMLGWLRRHPELVDSEL